MAKKLALATVVKRALIAAGWEPYHLFTDKLKVGHKRKWVRDDSDVSLTDRIAIEKVAWCAVHRAGYQFESMKWIRSASIRYGTYWAFVVKTKD